MLLCYEIIVSVIYRISILEWCCLFLCMLNLKHIELSTLVVLLAPMHSLASRSGSGASRPMVSCETPSHAELQLARYLHSYDVVYDLQIHSLYLVVICNVLSELRQCRFVSFAWVKREREQRVQLCCVEALACDTPGWLNLFACKLQCNTFTHYYAALHAQLHKIQPIVTDVVWSVCVHVCHDRKPCR